MSQVESLPEVERVVPDGTVYIQQQCASCCCCTSEQIIAPTTTTDMPTMTTEAVTTTTEAMTTTTEAMTTTTEAMTTTAEAMTTTPMSAPGFTCITQSPLANYGLAAIDSRLNVNDGIFRYLDVDDQESTFIYVIDMEILTTHEDFTGRAVQVADVEETEGSLPGFHGTHVSGIAGGITYGVCKKCQIKGVKIFDASGGGSFSVAMRGMEKARVHHNARKSSTNPNPKAVVNMSFGADNVDSGTQTTVCDAVRSMTDAGMIPVIAAGNGRTNACNGAPAGCNGIIVGCSGLNAGTNGLNFCSFSNFGSCVSILAPGNSILSTWHTGNQATATISGTSMSTPFVAGVAADYLAQQDCNGNPETCSLASVKSYLANRATKDQVMTPPAGTVNDHLFKDCTPA